MSTSRRKLMEEIYEQFLVCKICFEVYRSPKTLTCLHTFCEQCIDKHQSAELERTYRYALYTARTVTCPICRKKTELPVGGIHRLPDNIIVPRLVDLVCRGQDLGRNKLNNNGLLTVKCDICQAQSSDSNGEISEVAVAVSKCLDCCKVLCKKCIELHRRTKVTAEHSLVDVEVEDKDVICKSHEGELVRYYCEQCSVCICVVCAFEKPHQGHDVLTFSAALSRHGHSLDSLVSNCKMRVDRLRQQLERAKQYELDITKAEEQIRGAAIDGIASIRQHEKNLMSTLRAVFWDHPRVQAFLADRPAIESTIRALENACHLSDVIAGERSVELLLLKDDLARRMTSLLQTTHVELTPDVDATGVRFVPSSANNVTHANVDDGFQFGRLEFVSASLGDDIPKPDVTDGSENFIFSSSGNLTDFYGSSEQKVPENVKSMWQVHEESPNSARRMKFRSTSTASENLDGESYLSLKCPVSLVGTARDDEPVSPTGHPPRNNSSIFRTQSTTMNSDVQVDHKMTLTETKEAVDRSTSTDRRKSVSRSRSSPRGSRSFCDASTTTTSSEAARYSASSTDSRQFAVRSTATLTDPPSTANKGITTERPFQLDKVVSTTRIRLLTTGTNTSHVICVDSGSDAHHVFGDDKACGTNAVITVDAFTSTGNDRLTSRANSKRTLICDNDRVKSFGISVQEANNSSSDSTPISFLNTPETVADFCSSGFSGERDKRYRNISASTQDMNVTSDCREASVQCKSVFDVAILTETVHCAEQFTSTRSQLDIGTNTEAFEHKIFSDQHTNTLQQEVEDRSTNTIRFSHDVSTATPVPNCSINSTNTETATDQQTSTDAIETCSIETNTSLKHDAQTSTALVSYSAAFTNTPTSYHETGERKDVAVNTLKRIFFCAETNTDTSQTKEFSSNTLSVEMRTVESNTDSVERRTIDTNTVSLACLAQFNTRDITTNTEPVDTNTTETNTFITSDNSSNTYPSKVTVQLSTSATNTTLLNSIETNTTPINNVLSDDLINAPIGDTSLITCCHCGHQLPITNWASNSNFAPREASKLCDTAVGDGFVATKETGSGDGDVNTKNQSVGDSRPMVCTADGWTDAISVTHMDKQTSTVQVHMIHRNEATDSVNTVDVGTSPADDVTTTYRGALAAQLSKPSAVSRGTSTPARPELVDNETSTEPRPITVDAGTVTAADVTAAYRGLIGRIGGKEHRVTVSRGTMTLRTKLTDRETTTDTNNVKNVDRGSSPVKFRGIDKSVSVNRASLTEPSDIFVRASADSVNRMVPGNRGTASTGGGLRRHISESCPRMDSICEGSDESASDSESSLSCLQLQRSSAMPAAASAHRRPVLPSRPLSDDLRRFRLPLEQRILTSLSPLGQRRQLDRKHEITHSGWQPTLSSSGDADNKQKAAVGCGVEASTNTMTIEQRDQSTETDSTTHAPVDGKMAECINKLRTVRQRLEQQQSTMTRFGSPTEQSNASFSPLSSSPETLPVAVNVSSLTTVTYQPSRSNFPSAVPENVLPAEKHSLTDTDHFISPPRSRQLPSTLLADSRSTKTTAKTMPQYQTEVRTAIRHPDIETKQESERQQIISENPPFHPTRALKGDIFPSANVSRKTTQNALISPLSQRKVDIAGQFSPRLRQKSAMPPSTKPGNQVKAVTSPPLKRGVFMSSPSTRQRPSTAPVAEGLSRGTLSPKTKKLPLVIDEELKTCSMSGSCESTTSSSSSSDDQDSVAMMMSGMQAAGSVAQRSRQHRQLQPQTRQRQLTATVMTSSSSSPSGTASPVLPRRPALARKQRLDVTQLLVSKLDSTGTSPLLSDVISPVTSPSIGDSQPTRQTAHAQLQQHIRTSSPATSRRPATRRN